MKYVSPVTVAATTMTSFGTITTRPEAPRPTVAEVDVEALTERIESIKSRMQRDERQRAHRARIVREAETLSPEPQVITITAGDHVGDAPMAPRRADLLRATVEGLFESVFTSGWLDGAWVDDLGATIHERSLVVVGTTILPRPHLTAMLSSIARQFEQDALGLMVAHGGGEDSLVRG